MRRAIFLTKAELQNNHDRQAWAEALILQLPKNHDGRNSWLLNYGRGEEAKVLRAKRGLRFLPNQLACEPISGSGN